MPLAPITDVGTAIVTGIAAAFAALFSALPSILGALIVLAIGWIVAGWIGGLLARGLRMIRFDELADRSGVTTFLERSEIRADPARVIGALVKWYVRLVFVLMAANAVGLTAVATVADQILAFIPNLIVALLILGAFSWLAQLTRGIVRGALGGTGMPSADTIGTLAYVTVFAFGVVAAANQIGVAATLVNTLFIGVVAAVALAFGLAFGLGGRDEASQIWRDWRSHATQALRRAETTSATQPAVTPSSPSTGVTDGRTRMDDAEARRRRDEMMRRG
ncbi:MAG TPA: small-conductance mechanosensitive ion channel [Candidatus Limnocylindria bacterium]